MKVALVHELLTMKGGAEQVFRIFADMFPNAPIYTLLYNEQKLGDWFPKERVITSSVQKKANRLPLTAYRYNHHVYLNQFPRAVEQWDFSNFDLVISSSSAFAHGIITNGKPKHICYVHSPARYLWDRTHDVIEQASTGILGPLKKRYLERTFHKLRTWDAEVAPRPDVLIAASKEVKRRIELYWRRESDVIYPPIDDFWIQDSEPESRGSPLRSEKDYFLIVSTLAPYKRIDLAIEACNKLNLPLKIAGDGPDRKRLERLAASSLQLPAIEFLGYQEKEQLQELYTNAIATIFPGEEDFGLVPLESMACGTPVIGYKKGGALETITEGVTGTFFTEPTSESLQTVLSRTQGGAWNHNIYSIDALRSQAQQFSKTQFEEQIKKILSAALV